MHQPVHSSRSLLLVLLATGVWSACSPSAGTTDPLSTGGSPGGQATGGAKTGGASGTASGGSGSGGILGSGGAGTGGAISSGGALGSGGTLGTGGAASGGNGGPATGGSATSGGSGGPGAGGKGGAMNSGTGGMLPANCTLPTPVTFKADVQPILTASCGKNTSSGCHVVDGSSTLGSACPDGTNMCGSTHAYDWITAGSHASSCPETPNPKRFEVTIAVINSANPPTCSKSRKMPPPGMGTALTACQIATIQAWLAEPMVLTTHRKDDSSISTPYLMPPFN